MKTKFSVDYCVHKHYRLEIEADDLEQAGELAEEAWCNFDEHPWEESDEGTVGIEMTPHDYFVYQAWTEDTLVASGLTYEEAVAAQAEHDRLIEEGYCGDGSSVIGQLSNPEDKWVAQRLGLIKE